MKQFAWHRSGSIGDILCTLNLLKNFKAKHGNPRVVYRTHPWSKAIMEEFLITCGIDEVVDGLKSMSNEIPLMGYPVNLKDPLKGHPYFLMKEHLIEAFAKHLGVEPDFESLDFKKPPFPFKGDFVTIHVKSGWSTYKDWPLVRWEELCDKLKKQNIKVLQIAGPNDPIVKNAHGVIKSSPGENEAKMLFKMSISALANAKLHIGGDSWPNNALNIKWDGKRTKGLILWGSSNIVATGYKTNTNIVKGLQCQPCLREDPKMSKVPLGPCTNPPGQIYDEPKHECMNLITVDEVFNKAVGLYET